MVPLDDVKAKFFEDCTLIVQAPASFFWTGEYSVDYGQPALIQPINLWASVGIKPKSTGEFNFVVKCVKRSVSTFKVSDLDDGRDYEDLDLRKGSLATIVSRLRSALEQWKETAGYKGSFDVMVWSDIPIRVGLNSSAAMGTSLGMLISALETRSPKAETASTVLGKLIGQSLPALVNDRDFLRVFHLGWYFDNVIHSMVKSGVGTLASLIRQTQEEELILFGTEKRGFGTAHSLEMIPESFPEHLKYLASIKWRAYRFKLPTWFKDRIVFDIYSSNEFGNIESSLNRIKDQHRIHLEGIERFLAGASKACGSEGAPLLSPLDELVRIANYDNQVSSYIRSHYADVMGLVSSKIIACLATENVVTGHEEIFYDLIQESCSLVKAFGGSGVSARRAKRVFVQKGKDIYFKPVGPGDGDILAYGSKANVTSLRNLVLSKEVCDKRHPNIFATVHYSVNETGWVLDVNTPVAIYRGGPDRKPIVPPIPRMSLRFAFEDEPILYANDELFKLDERYYVTLLKLAAWRKRDPDQNGGMLQKSSGLLDPEGDICSSLPAELAKIHQGLHDVIKTGRGGGGSVRLNLEPPDIKIDKSLRSFRSLHRERAERSVNACEKKKLEHDRQAKDGIASSLNYVAEFSQLRRTFFYFWRNEELAAQALEVVDISNNISRGDDTRKSSGVKLMRQIAEKLGEDRYLRILPD